MVIQQGSKMSDAAKSLNAKQGVTVDRKHRLKHRFEVVKKLGQGTYGKVQLAVNKETGQEVAIKTIKKSKIESDQDLVRIRREIQIMSSVQHPHIIHIYEVFENKEKIVLVMQYASGGELYDYLSDKKVLTDTEARRVFRQIAAAIYYCHKNKICHRDLKLENVLLDERGNAKIADFGLSNVFDDRHLLATYCGSPLYASPEIVKGTPYYGPEVDCWSMGVLLYTLVYGAMPFDGSNFKRLVKQISEGDYYEPKKKSEASCLIRHLLTVNPSKRATIIDICSDWWVNIGFEHSLLQVAEDTANLTPVRIDLLLALAPVSPPPTQLVEEPQFEKPDNVVQPEETVMISSGHEDSEVASHDDIGEVASDSFAFVGGGMSTELSAGESRNDMFESRYGSDDEFLSAEAAAAMDGQCFKRDRSFDVGSVLRVSSMAHKDKKPRKSDSVQLERSTEERPEVVGGNSLPNRDLSTETLVEEETVELEPPANEKATIVEEKKALVVEDQSLIQPSTPESKSVTSSPKPEHMESKNDSPITENDLNVPKEKLVTDKSELTLPETCETKSIVTETNDTKVQVEAQTEVPKDKKIKRKIVSKKAEKKNEEAQQKPRESSPAKLRERSVEKLKEKSPSKEKSPEKCRNKSPIKSRPVSPEKTRSKSKSPEKPIGKSSAISGKQTPEPTEKKDLKKSGTTPNRILIRKRSEASPDKTENKLLLAASTVRKPGKLVMPKFLDSSQTSSPSPKITSEPKKLVLPMRSVSDAKKAFENKKSDGPTVVNVGSRKSSMVPSPEQTELPEGLNKADISKALKTMTVQEDEAKSTTREAESNKIETKTETIEAVNQEPAIIDEKIQVSEKPKEDVQNNLNECPKDGDKLEEKEKTDTSSVTAIEDSKDLIDEQKKIAAKSILKKSLAKARLIERKLSQQSSFESDVVSSCSTPTTVPTTPQTESKSCFKIPKPYTKEENTSIKPEMKQSSSNQDGNKSNSPQDETIWGAPLSPDSSSKLKRSVLSSSIESDMNNWRKEMEESLKRLSPEGASEDTTPYHSQNSVDSEVEVGPAPITRSYKKFTFTKDGSTITETGEVYSKPSTDGTWTKVEKKTKVTTQAQPKPFTTVKIKPLSSPKTMPQAFESRIFKEPSPLHHSDSQSSSGSNDIFDDIFDSWTGDNMFNNILKMDSVFDKFAKGSLSRRDSRRSSLRRPKTSREKELKVTGHSTDRESSDNDDDFDFHFDGDHPISCGSHGLKNLMKTVNKDLNFRLRAFKEKHGNFGRSLSRDRGEQQNTYEVRGRKEYKPTGTRSASRDRAESPRAETVLRFVIDPTKRQTSVQSEPRSRLYRDSLGNSEKCSSRESLDEKNKGIGSSFDGYASDYTTKYSSPLDSPDSNIDRASFYGTFRPRTYQKAQKIWPKDSQDSPSTPQSTRSGPELYDRGKNVDSLTDNRRRRVERWLETNTNESLEKEPGKSYPRTTRSLLSDVPEFATFHEHPSKAGFMKYSRSNTERLSDFDDREQSNLENNQRSHSQANLEPHPYEAARAPVFRTTSEIKMNNKKTHGSHEMLDRSQSEEHSLNSRQQTSTQNPASDRPPRQNRTGSQGFTTYTRSSSSNLSGFGITANPDGSIEMEAPSIGSRTPLLRMRVSFGSNDSPRIVTSTQQGLWNQDDLPDGSSLLEALKTQGYRNIMTQRLFRDPQQEGVSTVEPERTSDANENISANADEGGSAKMESSGNSTPQRGKDSPRASDSPAETENNACCMMETNNTEQDSANGIVNGKLVKDLDKTDEVTSNLQEKKNGYDQGIIGSAFDRVTAIDSSRINGYDHVNFNGCSVNENSDILNDNKKKAFQKLIKKDRLGDEIADGALTPDSLDLSKTRSSESITGPSKSTAYEEESVSERILRKSFYPRFNVDRPKRKPFRTTADTDYLFSEVTGGLWSRFSELESPDEPPLVSRRSAHRSNTEVKRSSANLDDILDASWLRKSESRASSLYDDYLSDDDAWTSKPPLPSHRRSVQLNNNKYSDTFSEKPGSLWNQRRDVNGLRSYKEPSVIDTVPDLTERRRSSIRGSAFSFYSPLVTPKSPVFPSRPIVPTGTQEVDRSKDTKLTEPQSSVLEGLDGRSVKETGLNSERKLGCWVQPGNGYELNGGLDASSDHELNNGQIARDQYVQQC